MAQSKNNVFFAKAESYVKENWGSPFVFGFLLLLFVTAISLSGGWTSIAESTSVFAFYLFVGGVVLQIVCLLGFRGKSDDEETM